MKKIMYLLQIFLYSTFYSQNLQIDYKFEVKNNMVNRVFEFPAILKIDVKGQKLYNVQYGISSQIESTKDNNGSFSLIDKSSYSYILYSNSENTHIIGDEINGKKYLFKDNFSPLKYEIFQASKTIKKIKLKKATTEFRGRKYTIWFDPSSSIKGGPWKFSNLPGIAYEIYDDENIFRWSLQSINKFKSNIINPFVTEELENNSLQYIEYPKLKYSSSVFFSDDNNNHGSYKKVEQKRDGLEKSFEWEK